MAKRYSLTSPRPQTDDANVIDCALLAAITSSLTDGATPGPGTPGLREARKRFQAMAGELAATKAEGERMRAIIERLPTTADGVPITSGMTLFGSDGKDGIVSMLSLPRSEFNCDGIFTKHDSLKRPLYSTREAALAAEPENPVAPPG